MRLYRVFPWDHSSMGRTAAGPLHVPRERQGTGRHDSPASYGALYCARHAISAVSEGIQFLRGHSLTSGDLRRAGGRISALVTIDLALTLFDERCRRALTVAERPVPLTTRSPELLAAAERLGIVVE